MKADSSLGTGRCGYSFYHYDFNVFFKDICILFNKKDTQISKFEDFFECDDDVFEVKDHSKIKPKMKTKICNFMFYKFSQIQSKELTYKLTVNLNPNLDASVNKKLGASNMKELIELIKLGFKEDYNFSLFDSNFCL